VASSVSDSASIETEVPHAGTINATDSLKIVDVLGEEIEPESPTVSTGIDSVKDSSAHLLNDKLLSSPAVSLSETGKKDSMDNSDSQFDATVYDLGLKLVPGAASASIKVNIGESVIRYAEWMNVPVSSIIRLNDMKNYRLKLGKRISIPVYAHSDLKKFETNRLEYLMAIEEDFYSRYQVVDQFSYTLKKGDSFWKISSKNKIPLWLLKKVNKEIDFSSPKKGTIIRIPVVTAKDSHEPPILEDAPAGEPVLQSETIESLEEVKE
jgi:LysM repeat protein